MLLGGAGDDGASGAVGADVLRGGAGDDTLAGDWGRDVLVGGEGADELRGGPGGDVFRFASAAEIGWGGGSDVIVDLGTGDRIDLRGVDADTGTRGVQGFEFVGADWFSGAAGELRFSGGRLTGGAGDDGAIDFALVVSGGELTAADLLL
ncbi:MAG: hypothetical protein QM699_09070 [Amaricoccus sp.]